MITRVSLPGCLLMLAPAPVAAQVFDGDSVIALHRAGLGDTALLAKIGNVPCGYDVSTDGLIRLKKAGISDTVIAAMVDRCNASARAQGMATSVADPAVARPPGIYVLQDWASPPKMVLMRPSKAGSVRVSGNGSILFPYVGRLVLPEPSSNLTIASGSPAFYFYFDASNRRVSDFGSANSAAAQSPAEFTLVRFRSKDGARDVSVGRVSAFNVKRGIDPKVAITFSSEEIGDSIFKVGLSAPLVPGEYGFVITGAGNESRVYDFTVR